MDFDIIKKYRSNSYNKLLLLDYYAAIVDTDNESKLPSERATKVLKKLLQKPSLKIIVVNGSDSVNFFLNKLSIECKASNSFTENFSVFDSYDFVLAIGNYRDENGILSSLPANETLIKIEVGQNFQNDNYRFENIDEVLTFLELLSI